MQDSVFPLGFSDPLPAPSSGARSTRSTRSVSIVTSAQMVPVISGLIKCLLPCDIVRAELAEASADGKDVWRDSRDATKKENERFEVEKEKLEAGGEAEVILLVIFFNAVIDGLLSSPSSRLLAANTNGTSLTWRIHIRSRCTPSSPESPLLGLIMKGECIWL
jgi:hypothetical protein